MKDLEFFDEVLLIPAKNGKHFKLERGFCVEVLEEKVEVPSGFITDLASIPKAFNSFYPSHGKYTRATLVHDYLYSEQSKISRNKADKIFLKLMKDDGVDFVTRTIFYTAVRFGGKKRFKDFRRDIY